MARKICVIILFNLLNIVVIAQHNEKNLFFNENESLLSPLKFTSYINVVNVNRLDSLYKIHSRFINYHDRRNLNVSPGLRYLTESLEGFSSEELDYIESIEILSKYVKNDSVRFMANYLKKYIKTTSKRENAIRNLKDKFKRDDLR